MERVVRWWVLLYALVGAQMAWLLRPFFTPTEVFLRPRAGNFFVAVLKTVAPASASNAVSSSLNLGKVITALALECVTNCLTCSR